MARIAKPYIILFGHSIPAQKHERCAHGFVPEREYNEKILSEQRRYQEMVQEKERENQELRRRLQQLEAVKK